MPTALEVDPIDWSEQQIDVNRDDGVEEFPVTWRHDERWGIGPELSLPES